MRRPLTRRERRIAALAVLALLLWIIWSLLIDSWFTGPLGELNAEAAGLREQQQRYAGQLAQLPALQAQLQQARQDPARRSSLFDGDDPSAVAADLMQHAVDTVKAHSSTSAGCEVTQRMPMVPEPVPGEAWRPVKVSLTLECAIEPLLRVLRDFEYSQPYLFVDNFTVRRAASAPALGGAGRLQVSLLLRGYLQAGAVAEPRP
ncbi:general secretion pathway protein GspM [Pseudomonas sp. v388]|uniref:type II secretion system protein GspM n=1 Tax=Pseudomonas sp. v388 TaxID=2479849 RepID=UPI000F77E352|nr:type II secretion system protein GspM [Pseudomonas sp. v388]RRV10682.1 general secretion pathway protein GspM [Pseudomonas sp. v388]